MLITTNPLSAQWMDGGNTFTAPGGCVKAQFGTLNEGCDIQFITNSIERMRLASNGNFGIGTTTPMRIFHVNGNIRFENLPMDTRSTAIMIDANGDLSTRVLSIDNWNTAFSWGNHAGLYRPVAWVPDWTDVANKPTFATVAFSGSYNDLIDLPTLNIADWNTAFSWGNHDTVGYLLEETDPQWIADSVNYYTKSNLQVDGHSQVHYGNLTNVPTDLSDFTDDNNLLFDGDWSSLSGNAPDVSIFTNDANYISDPDDADADPTNELQTLNASETALTLSDGGAVPLNALNYWTKEESNDDLHYEHGNVGIGITTPQQRLHIHSDARTTPDDNVDEVSEGFSISTRSGINRPSPTAITALQITNAESGTSQNDGLQFRLSDNNAVIYHREAGDLTMLNTINGNKLKLEQNGALSIGTNTQSHLFVSESGNVGVGTDEPVAKFHVAGDKLILEENNILRFDADNGGVEIGSSTNQITFWYGGSYNRLKLGDLVATGNVGIGTNAPEYRLDVRGKIRSNDEILVKALDFPDFVFEDTYDLPSFDKRMSEIKANKHLPYILPAKEMETNGLPVSETINGLTQNIEELYLYIEKLEEKISHLEAEINQVKN
jgi:hypothetical protein